MSAATARKFRFSDALIPIGLFLGFFAALVAVSALGYTVEDTDLNVRLFVLGAILSCLLLVLETMVDCRKEKYESLALPITPFLRIAGIATGSAAMFGFLMMVTALPNGPLSKTLPIFVTMLAMYLGLSSLLMVLRGRRWNML